MHCFSIIGNSSEQVPVLSLLWEAGEHSVFSRGGSRMNVGIECIPVAFSVFIWVLGDGCLPNQYLAVPLVDGWSIQHFKDGDSTRVNLFAEGSTLCGYCRCCPGRCWRCVRARHGTFLRTSMVCTPYFMSVDMIKNIYKRISVDTIPCCFSLCPWSWS